MAVRSKKRVKPHLVGSSELLAERRAVTAVERGLKTRIVALLMLILASSLGLWFAEFQPSAVILWLIIAFAGGYAVFEFDLFVSKVFVVVAAFAMEFIVLEGSADLLVAGSAGNILLVLFGIADIVLIYFLAKL